MEMVIIGIVTAIAALVVLLKLNIYRFLWAEVAVDILFSIALLMMFAGTLGGMVAAMVAGLVLSLTLWALKKRIGYDKPVICGRWYKPRLDWQKVRPS